MFYVFTVSLLYQVILSTAIKCWGVSSKSKGLYNKFNLWVDRGKIWSSTNLTALQQLLSALLVELKVEMIVEGPPQDG